MKLQLNGGALYAVMMMATAALVLSAVYDFGAFGSSLAQYARAASVAEAQSDAGAVGQAPVANLSEARAIVDGVAFKPLP